MRLSRETQQEHAERQEDKMQALRLLNVSGRKMDPDTRQDGIGFIIARIREVKRCAANEFFGSRIKKDIEERMD